MRGVTFIEVLNEADTLADDELLQCTFEITKYIVAEIEVNNERLITSARLRSPGEPGLTITQFYQAIGWTIYDGGGFHNWDIIKTVRVGTDPNYP
jgi:hypothetical protein